jgi:hypothetical protein
MVITAVNLRRQNENTNGNQKPSIYDGQTIQSGNQKPSIYEGQTIQRLKEKGQIMMYKTLHRKLKIE